MDFIKLYGRLSKIAALFSLCGICSFGLAVGQSGSVAVTPIAEAAALQLQLGAETSAQQLAQPKKVVILDMGGVLVDTARSGMAGEIGRLLCLRYAFSTLRNPAHIKEIAFRILDELAGKKQEPPVGCACAMADGVVMPYCMCNWMCGASGKEIIKEMLEKIDSGKYDGCFNGSTEKRLVRRLVSLIFDPEIMTKHTHPLKNGLKFVRSCAADENITLMILSNYGADAFEALYNKREAYKLFRHFKPSNIVVSGLIGTMKPYPSMYRYLIDQHHLDPADCIYIDDQEENIEAAKNMGIKDSFLVKDGNFAKVYAFLEQEGFELAA
ncbi:MAG: HAD-IA family hydrolase [Candidatus Dependentiae bacterium]|nr:HAD-IA family hydrolase [Candidatus Dependentiae bacterium]